MARPSSSDAVELAGIELRRRNVALHVYVAQRLPVLMVDPILIEQVLLNLLKNAAEAIDIGRTAARRAAASSCASCPAHRRRGRRDIEFIGDRHRARA